ncbi:MAG: epimerase [Gemmatimonadales bacterium]|nr:epimerase [Gemmatimonadales bacterium]NIN13164.1 epimerase [Gemmatimonadales bacterium]NIN51442.1 epimerase [Gemmatimonadales bacterium]NIP08906.1 epimerase [Gemmatimonadales bacterium]NIR03694.1 epimerase [Gemmatimonadales bacterium]
MSLQVVIFGATGTAGSAVLRECLSDSRVAEVVALTRRPLGVDAAKLREVTCHDFHDLEPVGSHLVNRDACFYCLGVSQARVRDPATYREITYDYTMAAARALLRRSPSCTFHFLTGVGTDQSGRSRMMWARVKGEAERALASVGLAGVVCWRPGFIHPFHPQEGRRFTERLSRVLYPVLRRFPGLAVSSVEFGRAMLQATLEGMRQGVLGNRDILALADRYQPQGTARGPS